jgi:hypothetical protein
MPIQEYDLVALTADIPAIHKDTRQPILLRCGQVGTVLMLLDDATCYVDFADPHGMTYAMETVPKDKLLLLLQEPEVVTA